jgi:hypothetical protein
MSRKPRADCLLAFVVKRSIEMPQWISKETLSQKSEEINNLLYRAAFARDPETSNDSPQP